LNDLLDLVRIRLRCKTTDQDDLIEPRRWPVARAGELAWDEETLGLSLPPMLKRLYLDIGNGGFGPGYGLIGMTGGAPDDTGKTAPEIYLQLREGDPEEPEWKWPEGLLPICHWGCAICSCVDCATPGFPMRIFDPNTRGVDDTWNDCIFDEAESFETWIAAWARGVDLWDQAYGEAGRVACVLAARGGR